VKCCRWYLPTYTYHPPPFDLLASAAAAWEGAVLVLGGHGEESHGSWHVGNSEWSASV